MSDWSQPHQASDLYQVLGLGPDASRVEIARAYRQRARSVHPDARPADPEAAARFRALTRAYEVLSDPARRDAYDRQRVRLTPPPAPRPPAWPAAAAGAPLWVGPVHVQPPAGSAGSSGYDRRHDDAARRAVLLAYLMSRYLPDEGWAEGWAEGWPL